MSVKQLTIWYDHEYDRMLCIRVIYRLPLMVSASYLIMTKPYTVLWNYVSVLWMNARALYYWSRHVLRYIKSQKETTRCIHIERDKWKNWKSILPVTIWPYKSIYEYKLDLYELFLVFLFLLIPKKEKEKIMRNKK